MTQEKCLLCGRDAVVHPQDALERRYSVDCSICGKYSVSDSLCLFRELSSVEREKLRPILLERSLRGLPPVIIVTEDSACPNGFTVEELLGTYPKTPKEMMDRALLNLGRLAEHPCDELKVPYAHHFMFFGRHPADMTNMMDAFESEGYIKVLDQGRNNPVTLVVQPHGWERIAELEKSNTESRQVFVAMWFAKLISTSS